jgi:hypothetical protein
VPHTTWGNSAGETAGIIAGAATAAATCGGIYSGIVIAASVAIIGAAARATQIGMARSLIKLDVPLTDGSIKSAGISDIGMDAAEVKSTSILSILEWVKARYRMYSTRQPFTMRSWQVDEKKYSTPDCGFTFTFSGNKQEGVNFIADNRSIIVGTDSSERTMPNTINGESQSAVTGSFFGSERIQAASAQNSTYFVQKGGQRIMRLAWQPNIPVPMIEDVQKLNIEILRDRKITALKSDGSLPSKIWVLTEDGGVAVLTENVAVAWSRITAGGGKILDAAGVPVNGMTAFRLIAKKNSKGIQVIGIPESLGEKGGVFLDEWRPYLTGGETSYYESGAVIYDSNTDEVFAMEAYPVPGIGKYIGYPYVSRVRSLPALSGGIMKPQRVARVKMRLVDSHKPKIAGFPTGKENQIVGDGQSDGGRSGVWNVPVPGNVELDAGFELYTRHPDSLSIVAWDTEEDA